MVVMLVYVLLASVGEVFAFGAGAVIDTMVGEGTSMILYMALFFGVLFLAWPVAVRITERYLPQYAQ